MQLREAVAAKRKAQAEKAAVQAAESGKRASVDVDQARSRMRTVIRLLGLKEPITGIGISNMQWPEKGFVAELRFDYSEHRHMHLYTYSGEGEGAQRVLVLMRPKVLPLAGDDDVGERFNIDDNLMDTLADWLVKNLPERKE